MLSVEHSTIETLKKRFDGNVGVLVVMGQNPGTRGTLSCLMDGYSPYGNFIGVDSSPFEKRP